MFNIILYFRQGVKLIHNTAGGRVYGVEPKCIRVKEMHRLFFYLVYGYSGIVDGDQTAFKEEILLNHPDVDEDMLENIPKIYQVSAIAFILMFGSNYTTFDFLAQTWMEYVH